MTPVVLSMPHSALCPFPMLHVPDISWLGDFFLFLQSDCVLLQPSHRHVHRYGGACARDIQERITGGGIAQLGSGPRLTDAVTSVSL